MMLSRRFIVIGAVASAMVVAAVLVWATVERTPASSRLMPEGFTGVFIGMSQAELLAARSGAKHLEWDVQPEGTDVRCRPADEFCLETKLEDSFYSHTGYFFGGGMLETAVFRRSYRGDVSPDDLRKAVVDSLTKYGTAFRKRVHLDPRANNVRFPLLYLWWETGSGNVALVLDLAPVSTRQGTLTSRFGSFSIYVTGPGVDSIGRQSQPVELTDPVEIDWLFDQNLPFLDELIAATP